MTDKFEEKSKTFEFQLPNNERSVSVEKLEYGHLKEIWNSHREFNIYKTTSKILVIGGTKESTSYNSYLYSSKFNEGVVVDAHSHPKNLEYSAPVDCFGLQDWIGALDKKTEDVCLLYYEGAINIHFNQIPKNKLESESRFQNIVEEFIAQNQISKKYVPNKKNIPHKERLYYVIDELVKNNQDVEYQISRDLLAFASKEPGISFRRFDLKDPNSQDVEDFLKLFNK